VRRILSIVAPANGSGKTGLVSTILAAFPGRFTAAKFTTVYRDGEHCPKTETACACHELHGHFTIIDDPRIIEQEGTDTGRMSRSGASRTLWCLALPSAHRALWDHLTREIIRPDERLVTEGNRAAGVIGPERIVMVVGPRTPRSRWKDDAWALMGRADLVVINEFPPPEGPRSGDRAAAESAGGLLSEIRSRTSARVIVQDVSVPLTEWKDPTLLDLAAVIAEGEASPAPDAGRG
jgi:hypothetical protein